MAYVDPLDPTTPALDADLGEGDDRIRELKRALIERLETIIQDIDNDPLEFIAGIIGTDAIADSAVTYAKIQDVSATDKLLGRETAGAGVIEEIDCTAAGRALLDDADAAAQRTTLGLGDLATKSDLELTDIPDGLITLAKLGYNGGARRHHSGAQSVADASAQLVVTATSDEDNGGYTTSPTRYTVPAGFDGQHLIGMSLRWDGNATGYRFIFIQKNGVEIAGQRCDAAGGGDVRQTVSTIDDAVEGDYYEFVGYQTSGGALNIAEVQRTYIRLFAP